MSRKIITIIMKISLFSADIIRLILGTAPSKRGLVKCSFGHFYLSKNVAEN